MADQRCDVPEHDAGFRVVWDRANQLFKVEIVGGHHVLSRGPARKRVPHRFAKRLANASAQVQQVFSDVLTRAAKRRTRCNRRDHRAHGARHRKA